MQLLERTRNLLNRFDRKEKVLRDIADASGGKVPYEWLRKFARGDIPDPSVNKVQDLHDHLKTYKPKRD